MGTILDQFLGTPESEREYLEVIPPTPGWKAALEAVGWVIVPVVQAGRVVYDKIRKAGLPTVAAVAPDVAEELYFPLGSNGSKVLFRRHPYDAVRYLPAAEYNPYVLKDKIAELARVMISAGATSFQITADTASTSELALDVAATVETAVSGSFKAARKGATKIIWSYSGNGQNTGTLPEGLFWFNHERDWQAIWESAVYGGAKSHAIEVFQDTGHELSGNLAAKFAGAGFQLGGSFRDTGSSRLKVEVDFSHK
jgi:hypothetical protein